MIRTSTGYKTICVGGSRKKAEGLVAGVSDLILLVSRGGFGALCIELKTPKGRQSAAQKDGNEKRKSLVISISSAETLKPFQKR